MYSLAAAGFAFTFGCFIGCFLKSSMILPSLIIFSLISICLFVFRKKLKLLFTVSLFITLSFLAMFISNSLNFVPTLNLSEDEYIGTVEDIENSSYITEYTVKITQGELEGKRVLVKTYEKADINKGDRISFSSELKTFEDNFGFDQRISSLARNIVLYSEAYNEGELQAYGGGRPLFTDKVRDFFSVSLYKALPDYAAELTDAMLLGNRELLSESVKEAFKTSGGSHFLAVSGLHLSVLVAFLGSVVRRIKLKRNIGDVIILLFIVLYMFISGFRYSVIRAGIMSILVVVSRLIGKMEDPLSSLSFSGFMICLCNPYAAADVGFILSFTATLGIILSENIRKEYKEKLKLKNPVITFIYENTAVSLSACIFTVPFSMCYFGGVSIVTLFTSLVLTLPVSAIVSLGFITAVVASILPSLAAFPALLIAVFAKFTLWYVSLIPASLYIYLGESAFFVFAALMLMLYVLALKPGKAVVKTFIIAFVLLLAGSSVINYSLTKPLFTVERFGYSYVVKITDKHGTSVFTEDKDRYISVYGDKENVYDLNSELTKKEENYIINLNGGFAKIIIGENKVILNTDLYLNENADVHVSFGTKLYASGDLNVLVTDKSITEIKDSLPAGNYILTEKLSFGFENNKIKFY